MLTFLHQLNVKFTGNRLAAVLLGGAVVAATGAAQAGFVVSDPNDATTATVDPNSPALVTREAGNISKSAANALDSKVVFQFDDADNSGPDIQFSAGLETGDATIAITSATAGSTPFSATVIAGNGGSYAVITGATAAANGATSSGGRLATNRGTVTIAFDTGVQVFGLALSRFLNSGSGNGSVDFYAGNALLDSFEVTIGETNFIGYDAGSSQITSVVVTNSAPGSEFTLDDFVVAVAVPEPASMALLGLGVASLVTGRRKR